MSEVKFLLGVIMICMATGEMATVFLAFPAVTEFADSRVEWWAEYMPLVMLVNSLIAVSLLVFLGTKMMLGNPLITEKQKQWFFGGIRRWLEKRKYGYCRSAYVINEVETK